MAWIESHQELGRHPKTRRLARALNISLPAAVGHLQFLWWWALDYAQSGNLVEYDHQELAEAALWEGEPTAFVTALIKAGFLDVDLDHTGDLLIHDWEEYAGKLLAQRAANAEKQRAYRNRHKPQAPPPVSGNTREALSSHTPAVTVTSPSRNGATEQYRTVQNTTIETLEERESRAADQGPSTPLTPAIEAELTPVVPDPPQARRATPVPKPSAGFDFPGLWDAVTAQQGYRPTWNYAAETKAIKHLLSSYPGALPADFVRFLAYVRTCWPFCNEPTTQPTFSRAAKDFGAWYTGGQPAQQQQGDIRHAPAKLSSVERNRANEDAADELIAQLRAYAAGGSPDCDPDGLDSGDPPLQQPPDPRRKIIDAESYRVGRRA